MKKENVKDKIIDLLINTKRNGVASMLEYLENEGFFESPASTRFHGAYPGGLAAHSLRVYVLLIKLMPTNICEATGSGQNPLPLDCDSLVIATLLHDVCKMGAYIGTEEPYKWNKQQPKGHALLSIERIKKHIELTELEELMIKYHMGVYGLNEFYDEDDWQTGEYPLRGDHTNDKEMSKEESKKARYGKSMANAWYHNPIVKVIYFCDELATLEEKAKGI